CFAQLLASHGLSEEEDFLRLLGHPGEAIQLGANGSMQWMENLNGAFSRQSSHRPIPMPEALRHQQTAGFLDAIAPLIVSGLERVEQGVQALAEQYSKTPFDGRTVLEILLGNLPAELLA